MMQGAESAIELFHGYTYSGHPVVCAAALATLDIYRGVNLLSLGALLTNEWQTAMHSLSGAKYVVDIRTIGIMAGIELEPRPDTLGSRAHDVFVDCFNKGTLIRVTGDIIALSPPLILERNHIEQLVTTLSESLQESRKSKQR